MTEQNNQPVIEKVSEDSNSSIDKAPAPRIILDEFPFTDLQKGENDKVTTFNPLTGEEKTFNVVDGKPVLDGDANAEIGQALTELAAEVGSTELPSDAAEEVVEVPLTDVNADLFPATNSNVTQDYKPYEEKEHNNFAIALPNCTPQEFDNTPAVGLVNMIRNEDDPKTLHQFAAYNMFSNMVVGNVFVKSLERQDSDWRQSVEVDGKRFRFAKPVWKNPNKEEALTGENALLMLDNTAGTGGHINVPLIHSGIWVDLNPCTEFEYITLNERLKSIKEEFGKSTMGLVFSNNKVYTINLLFDFIMEHIRDCSLVDYSRETLMSVIKVTDLLVLVAGMAHTMYPNGFDYVSPCTASSNCEHIYQARLKIANSIWFDRNSFTKAQKEFMAERTKKRTLEEVMEYQRGFDTNEEGFDTGNGLKVYFKVPTMQEHIESGSRWLESIEMAIGDAFGQGLSRAVHTDYMQSRINLSVLRQYAHFFKTITFVESGNFVEDTDTIETMLVRMSNMEDTVDSVLEAVGQYIDRQTKSLVAIPRYTCPACNKEVQEGIERHPYLIPLDTVNLFFNLGGLKTRRGSLN